MNTYEVSYGKYKSNIVAKSASKAKYEYYLELSDTFSFDSFIDCAVNLKVKVLHRFRVSDLFGDFNNFEYVKRSRGLDFIHMGMKCIFDGRECIIIGTCSGANLALWDIEKEVKYYNHPYWKMTYLDNQGHIIKSFEKAEEAESE